MSRNGELNIPTLMGLTGMTKSFPGVLANDRVDLAIEPGQIHALLGENGAGKSTTMRMITGYLTPSSGTVEINGKNLQDNESFCKESSYVPSRAVAVIKLVLQKMPEERLKNEAGRTQ